MSSSRGVSHRAIFSVWIAALSVAVGVACKGSSGSGWHDDAGEPLLLSIGKDSLGEIQLGMLQKVPAPPVEFAALVVEDRNHYPPVLAPDSGTLISVRPQGSVRGGDTLWVWKVAGEDSVSVVADREGNWLPKMHGRKVEHGDTLGTLGIPGTWIAEGAVGEYQAAEIHPGDPATIRIWSDPDTLIRGNVEWVRRPPYAARGVTTVGVEFPHTPGAGHGSASALVTVTPSGPGDSVLAAPEEALVRLPNGLALLIPRDSGQYEVRFVFIGPTVGGLVVIREGVDAPIQVVSQGVEQLKRAASDSLRLRQLGR